MNQAASAAVAPAPVPRNLLRRLRRVAPIAAAACAALTLGGALIRVYAEIQVTAAVHGEKLDVIMRELGQSQADVRAFRSEMRDELHRIGDRLDGRTDRPPPR